MKTQLDPADGWLPLTAAQRGLFFAHQLDPSNPAYTTAEVLEFGGPVDTVRLRSALESTYNEFEQLRVELAITPSGPVQRVRPAGPVSFEVVEVASAAEAEAWLRAELARPLAIMEGELTRSGLLRLPAQDWWWHSAHHVVVDGYGIQQMLRRVSEHYSATADRPVKELCPASLRDVVEADLEPTAAARDFWNARLADYTGPASLAGHIATPAASAIRLAGEMEPGLQEALVAGAKRLGVPWSDLLTAAVGSYLARMTAQPAIRLGLPLMNRTEPGRGALVEAHTVCTAMNVLPITVLGAGTVAEVLAATTAEQAEIRLHPRLRQEELARKLGDRGQLFGVQLNVIPFDLELKFADVVGVVRNLTAGPVEDLTIGLRGIPGRARGRSVRLEFDANPKLYSATDLAGHLERLSHWISQWAAAELTDPVEALELLTEAERHRVVVEFNDTAVERETATLGHRFAAAVRRAPDAIALRCDGQTRTYRELETRARQIAGSLLARGVQPGDVVGLALERSLALYEAIHALILIGAVYLPIDADLPAERRAGMLADAEAVVVLEAADLTAASLAAQPSWEGEPFDDVDAAAYLLFTSGSTGRPKGVVINHAAIDNRLAWMQHHLSIGAGDVVVHKTPISFDVSIWELYWPLQVGASVEIAAPGAHRDPRALAEVIAGASVVHFVPSMLRAFLADRVARKTIAERGGVKHLVTSGEALTPDLVADSAAVFGVAPTNLYGPTEAAVDVTVWNCDAADPVVPIGYPIWNTTCFVLDSNQRPMPIGAPGELWLGGVQLARGYQGRDDLTAERFVETEFGRLYRTGDIAAWRHDGALIYMGRSDDQVKIRGQRVELGEIESVVAARPGVNGVVVGVLGSQLVAWLLLAPDADLEVIEHELRGQLPAAWVPSRWVPVTEIPVGSTGKADRKALAAATPTVGAGGQGATEAPGSLVEERVATLMEMVLSERGSGAVTLGPTEDFFTCGGDSLSVLALLNEVEEAWGIELDLASVFSHPTPRGLATVVEERLSGGSSHPGEFAELLTLRPGTPGVAPLFFLPPAGGLGWCYLGLLKWLPAEVPVHTIQAPGLATGTPEPVDSLTALAVRQLAVIRSVVGHGQFHVAGWSLGGMAAHAVAGLATGQGQQVGAVVALDAYPSAQWQELPEPTEADAMLGLLRLGAATLPEGVEVNRATVTAALQAGGSALATLPEAILQGCLSSVLEAARLVRTEPPSALIGDMTMVVAAAPRPETWLDPAGWEPLVAGTVDRVEIDCGHGEVVRRAEVGDLLARLISVPPTPDLSPWEA